MAGILSSTMRTVRGILPHLPTSEEKISFARFQNEMTHSNTETEIHKMSAVNGFGAGKRPGSGASTPTGGTEAVENGATPFPEYKEEDDEAGGEDDKRKERNRISAWQAGWNVTNAIQVS